VDVGALAREPRGRGRVEELRGRVAAPTGDGRRLLAVAGPRAHVLVAGRSPDKEDLLFAEDADWQAALRTAIDRQPAGAAPFAVLRGASAAVTRALEERREEVRRRGEVIASAPALTARERAKHAAWEEVLAAGLRERGVAAGDARLLGRIAVACYDEALTRWLAQDGWRRTLEAEIDATFAQAAALAA
jgi:hypothetical protein